MSLKIEQGEETKKNILFEARKLFGSKGYHNTSLEEVYKNLGLTRGALYHHFSGKKELFYEMCLSYNLEIITDISKWNWKEFRKNWIRFLDLTEDSSFVQIWIKDLTSVLNSEEMDRIDNESIGKSIQILISKSIQEGYLKKVPVLETSQIIIGIINQSLLSLSFLKPSELKQSKKNIIKVIDLFLESLEV